MEPIAFSEHWLGLWVCDDARAVDLHRIGGALRVAVTDAGGKLLGDFPARFEAPNPMRAARADSLPADRMGRVYAEVGTGAEAQTYTLYLAVLDTRPEARFKYREARSDDPLAAVVLEPTSSASWLEINTSDPWSDDDYGMISWAAPLIPYRHATCRADPHPMCPAAPAAAAAAGRFTSHKDAPPADPGEVRPLRGEEVPSRSMRCVRCGSAGAVLVRAWEDAAQQRHLVLRCDRCGRWSQWSLGTP